MICLPLLVLIIFLILLKDNAKLASPLLALVTFGVLYVKRNWAIKAKEANEVELQKKYKDASEHLEWLYSAYDFDVVPEDYREPEAMVFFVKVLNSGRALSLNQAINMYEDDKHKKELLILLSNKTL